jgi:fructokinase
MTARIGIDLGGTKVSGVVLGDADRVLAALRTPTPRDDYGATVATIASLVARLESDAGLRPGIASVGIGTPGAWHPRLARMKNCNSTWLNDRPLLPDLQQALGPRVRLANDADCLALSEAVDGAAHGADPVFGVILGTGVGGALVAGGRLVQGPNALTGEWGHTPLPYLRGLAFPRNFDPAEQARFQLESGLDDRPCYCGRWNCVETFLSGPGLEATHAALWQSPRSSDAIASAHDLEAAATFDLYRHMLARSLAQVVNVIDPAAIVLGGGLSNVDGLAAALQALIPRYAFSSVAGDVADVQVTVHRARWGDDSGVRGAARLWPAATPR